MEKDSDQIKWFIEGYLEDPRTLRRWTISSVPYRVGRHADMDLRLPFKSVSSRHAEIYLDGEALGVRDLGSTNGTFVNRKRIEEDTQVAEGDILHFSEFEFRVGRMDLEATDPADTMFTSLSEKNLPGQMAIGVRQFKEMLLKHSVVPMFQPIIELEGEKRIGFEILGRGDQEGLDSAPIQLFRIAASLGLEAELSTLFRTSGIEQARRLPGKPKLFVNTHPIELESPMLLTSLAALREKERHLAIVLEIHETAVTDLDQMKALRSQLSDLEMELAYDDFGAGQARLLELVDAPPDYLKFDASLIRNLHKASGSKQKMMESLIRIGQEIGVRCLAEGIETEEESTACRELGFHLAQGYFFGRPAPVEDWI